MSFYERQPIGISSKQTSKTRGTLCKVERDPVWGHQYQVMVVDNETGEEELFWLREDEIYSLRKSNFANINR